MKEASPDKKQKKSNSLLWRRGAGWAFFEQRLQHFSKEEKIRFICELIDDIQSNSNIFSIEQWCQKKRLASSSIYDWAHELKEIHDGLKFAKEGLGVRRENGILLKRMDSSFMKTLHMFLDRYKEHDDREDNRKIKLADKGVTTGETRIIVVNENKTYEGENK